MQQTRKRHPLKREMGERELIKRPTMPRIQDVGISRPGVHLLRMQQARRRRRREHLQRAEAAEVWQVDLTGMGNTLRECIYEFGTDPEGGYLAAAKKILKNPSGRYTQHKKKKLMKLAAKCEKISSEPGKIGGRRRTRRRRGRRGGRGIVGAMRTALVPASLYYLQKRQQRKSRRKRYRKGSPSKTRKGREDFITHLGSNVFDRLGHWFRGSRKPYTRKRRAKQKK